MEQLPQSTENLWYELTRLQPEKELVQLVFRQLSIDFERSGNRLPVPDDAPVIQWKPLLAHWLALQAPANVCSLLYLIDIPENLITAPDPKNDYFSQLSEAIIYREMVKVYYKIRYSP